MRDDARCCTSKLISSRFRHGFYAMLGQEFCRLGMTQIYNNSVQTRNHDGGSVAIPPLQMGLRNANWLEARTYGVYITARASYNGATTVAVV